MNIHILSNSPTRINSGFGIVCRNLALGFSKIGHNVSVSNMQGIYDVEYWNDIVIYPLNSISGASGNSFYTNEAQQFIRNLKDSKAECVIFIYPCYDDVSVLNRLHEVHPNTYWYYPCEFENIPVNYIKELKKVKKVIPMTKQGCNELKKRGLNGIKEIYHGYDPDIFRVVGDNDLGGYCKWSTEKYQLIGDRRELCERGCFKCNSLINGCNYFEKEKVVMNFGDGGEELAGNVGNLGKIKDTFGVDCIYGFVGDNNGKRKRIDLLLNSYMSLSSKIKNDSILLLHTLPFSMDGYNLVDIIKKWEEKHGKGSSGKIAFVYGYDGAGNSWSNNALNTFYNTIDINVSTSSGEGFNLPCIESMACRKPNIAPNFSSFVELIGNEDENRGLLASLSGYETLTNGARRGIVSVKNMTDCMERLYIDKDERKKLGDRGSEWVKQYTWNNIVKEFDSVLNFDGVLNRSVVS